MRGEEEEEEEAGNGEQSVSNLDLEGSIPRLCSKNKPMIQRKTEKQFIAL